MITTFEAVDIVWKRLNESPLKTAISGGIYKLKRPLNSNLEDVVVNSVTMVNLPLQEGVLNVNVHVPNLVINTQYAQDNTLPDHARMATLTKIAIELLEEVWSDDGQIHYEVQKQEIFEEDEINSHFSNIRLSFYSVNI